jgi:hypothetical protein
MASETSNPGTVGVVQQAARPAVDICRAVYGGTLVLREKEEFLPQWEKEKDDKYANRLAQAVLFNAFKKTIKGLTGIVFRENPSVWDDVDDEIAGHLENVDLTGQHLDVFAQAGFREKLIDGHDHILVDWHGPEGARSKKDESAGMARPYWTLVRKSQVVRDWTRQDGGMIVLVSFAYEEEVTVKSGEFGQKLVKRIRQFDLTGSNGVPLEEEEELPPEPSRRVLFRSWIEDPDNEGEPDVEVEGKLLGERMRKIPIVTDYAERVGFMRSEPPFLDLALENIKHWVIRSDRDTNLHVTSIPILNVYGLKAEDIQTLTIGTSMGIAFPGGKTEQGSEYTEAQGHGLKHTREELLDIEKRMASLGLSMLERQTRQAETEKKAMLDQKSQDSELAAQARATSSALGEALELHAIWLGKEPSGSITLDTEFSVEPMSPEMLDKLIKAVGEGDLSVETLWDRMLAGRILGDDFDPELEKERLAQSGASEAAAMAEAARMARETLGVEEEEEEEGEGDE